MYWCSKTAFFYYHSPLLMLRWEHKLCSLNRGGRTSRGGEAGMQENRQRIVKLRSRFRPVQISPPRVPGSSDEAVRLPFPSLRTGCSLCSSLPHKAQLPVYKPHCHLLASTLPLSFAMQSCFLMLGTSTCSPTPTECRAALTFLMVWLVNVHTCVLSYLSLLKVNGACLFSK